MVQVNSYLIWDERELACIIDPGFSTHTEELALIDFLDEQELQLSASITTHMHFDHVIGARFIQDYFGIATEVPQSEIEGLPDIDTQLKAFGIPVTEGKYDFEPKVLSDYVTVGNTTLQVINTPGHSPGHVTFYDEESGVIFCGDVIFKNGFGRYDLWGSSYELLMESIDRLLNLPPQTVVLSGHGSATTIGEERKQ